MEPVPPVGVIHRLPPRNSIRTPPPPLVRIKWVMRTKEFRLSALPANRPLPLSLSGSLFGAEQQPSPVRVYVPLCRITQLRRPRLDRANLKAEISPAASFLFGIKTKPSLRRFEKIRRSPRPFIAVSGVLSGSFGYVTATTTDYPPSPPAPAASGRRNVRVA